MTGLRRPTPAGAPATSPRSSVMSGCARIAAVIARGELFAVDGQRRAGRHADFVGHAHDERTEPAHLLFEQADGVVELVAAKGVAADQFGERVGLVHGRGHDGPHLVQPHTDAARGSLPGGLDTRPVRRR